MSAARYHGPAGNDRPCAMHAVNVAENIPGPKIIASPRNELSAPCNSPCSDAETRCVIMDCDGGPASPHNAFTGIAARKIQQTGAKPKNAKPSAPKKNQTSPRAKKKNPEKAPSPTPTLFPPGPPNPAIVIIDAIPTTARERPM